MRHGWRKRALAYSVLLLVVIGTLYQLQGAAVEVDFTVDLIGARLLDGRDLVKLRVEFLKDDEEIFAVTEFSFPRSLHPDGPPTATPQVPLALPRGTYEVKLAMYYGEGPGATPVVRRMEMTIEGPGAVRLRAAP